MYKKIVLLIATFLLLLSLTFRSPIMESVKATPAEIIVQPSDSIQEAINNASTGDTIRVKAGTYYERITVNKSIRLIGEKPVTTIIDGNESGGIVVKVVASHVEISNFTIQNAGSTPIDYGVQLSGVINVTFCKNIIRRNYYGLYFLRSNISNIIDNTIIDNYYVGIYLSEGSSNNDIVSNTIEENSYAFYLSEDSQSNTFYHNNFINNANPPMSIGSGTVFDNGAEGNYWSDYVGADGDGDGIGDIGYPQEILPWDKYPLMEPWSLIRVFDVYQKGEHHYVTIYSNSTVGHRRDNVSFFFSQPERQIRFNVTGPSNTTGFCNVTIPKKLLNATPPDNWIVLLDTAPISFTPSYNDTHTSLNFTYTHSTHRVKINGTEAIPNLPPIANFTYSPLNPTVLDFINFVDTSNDTDGTIVSWYWEFGDGTNSTEQNATHKYAYKGSYNVTLTVTDNVDASNATTQTITVVNAAPTANFTYSPTAPTVDQKIEFTDTSKDPEENIVERLWDFGDGNVTTITTPVITNITHVYTAAGTYNVTLTIKDDENATDTMLKTITVRKVGTKLTLNVSSTATAKKAIVVTAILEDENDNPISDETIDFYFYENGEWKPFDSASTNVTGFASVTYEPAIWGEHQIMAIYNGTLKYVENNSTATITVNPQVVTLTIDAPSTVTSGKPITITAILKDENGAPISNATIIFYFFEEGSWKTIGSSETSPNSGVAVIEYTPLAAGTFFIKAEFPGNQIYGKSSDVITLNVRFDYTPYIVGGVAIAVIAVIAVIVFAIWRKRKKPSKSKRSQE